MSESFYVVIKVAVDYDWKNILTYEIRHALKTNADHTYSLPPSSPTFPVTLGKSEIVDATSIRPKAPSLPNDDYKIEYRMRRDAIVWLEKHMPDYTESTVSSLMNLLQHQQYELFDAIGY